MKNITKLFIGLFIFCCQWTTSYALFVHVIGSNYTCPNSQLIYHYDDDYSWGLVTITITNGLIYNEIDHSWQSFWSFDRAQYSQYSGDWNYKIDWDPAAIGTIGHINIEICDGVFPFICSNGDKDVLFNSSPANPSITGSGVLDNCHSQHNTFTAGNMPEFWRLDHWNYSSHIRQYGSGTNPVMVEGTNTTWQGTETLTGVFKFTTDGHTCGSTINKNKSIWLGVPLNTSKKVDGNNYSGYGYYVCPGNHWVEVSWNGANPNTSWRVQSGITYIGGATQCDFTFPSSGYSSIWIIGNGVNACGTSADAYFNIIKQTSGCGLLMVEVFPNPGTNEITIETSVLNEQEKLEYNVVADEVLLLDLSGSILVDEFPKESNITIDTRKIPKGDYYLHIKVGEDIVKKHIIIDN